MSKNVYSLIPIVIASFLFGCNSTSTVETNGSGRGLSRTTNTEPLKPIKKLDPIELFVQTGNALEIEEIVFSPKNDFFITKSSIDVKAWDSANNKLKFSLAMSFENIDAVTFSKNSQYIATLSHNKSFRFDKKINDVAFEYRVHLWDAVNGSLVSEFTSFKVVQLFPSGGKITFSNNGEFLYVLVKDKLLAYSAASGEISFNKDLDLNVSAAAFGRDKLFVIDSSSNLYVMDFQGDPVYTENVNLNLGNEMSDGDRIIEIRPLQNDNKLLISPSESSPLIVNYSNGDIYPLPSNDPASAISVSTGGDIFATGTKNGLIDIWNSSSIKLHKRINAYKTPVSAISFSK